MVGSGSLPFGLGSSARDVLPRTEAEATAKDNRERNSLRPVALVVSPFFFIAISPVKSLAILPPDRTSSPIPWPGVFPLWNRPLMARSQATSFQIGCSGPQYVVGIMPQ